MATTERAAAPTHRASPRDDPADHGPHRAPDVDGPSGGGTPPRSTDRTLPADGSRQSGWRSVVQRARILRADAGRNVRGIRGRVVVGYVLLVAGSLLLTLLIVRTVLLVRTDRQIEDALVQEVEELRRLASGTNPTTGEPFGTDAAALFDVYLSKIVPADGEVVLTIVDGQPYKETLGAPEDLSQDIELVRRWSQMDAPLRLDVGTGPQEARTLAVPLLDANNATTGVFVVAFFPADLISEVDQTVLVIGGVGVLVVLLAAGVALALARRVLRPVSELTDTARRINDSELATRFDPRGDDELAMMGAAFNEMLDRLEAGFSAQRDVLDDVAHEMRTPITIIGGHLELLDDDPDERAAAVALCLDELDRMNRYVDDLLLVATARRPDFLHLAPVDVGEFAQTLLAKVSALGDRDWQLCAAPHPGSFFVEADEARLTQAVVSLASNAVQHTEVGSVVALSLVPGADGLRSRSGSRDRDRPGDHAADLLEVLESRRESCGST